MYTIFFGVGVGFIALSLVIGELVEIEGTAFSIFRPTLIAVFLTVMGGLGMILTPRFDDGAGIVLVVSLLSGAVVASIIHFFVMIPLHMAQNTSAFDKSDTIGMAAKVISRVPQGGYGKISYSVSGSVVTSPAKSEDGGEIESGENVEIINIEGNTYFVRRTV